MKKNIPDLRVDHQEFTLEHCSAMIEQLVRVMNVLGEDASEAADAMDLESMRDDLLNLYPADRLSVLFSNPWGKPFLVGLFFGHFILKQKVDGDE